VDFTSQWALAGGLALGSGFRLYATVLLVGMLQRFGGLELPAGLSVLSHDWVLWTSAVLTVAEFVADKVPAFDSLWDALQALIRIPAGALLAHGALSQADPTMQWMALLVGGGIAGTTQAGKASTRLAINHSPEPFSNWLASFSEDGLWALMMWLMVAHPLIFGVALTISVMLSAALAWALWRFLRAGLRRLQQWRAPVAATP